MVNVSEFVTSNFHHEIKTCNKHPSREFLKWSTIYISLKLIQRKYNWRIKRGSYFKFLWPKYSPESLCCHHPHIIAYFPNTPTVTLQNILKVELWVYFPTISHRLMFVIPNSSFGSEQWHPDFESQWLFIILIIDLTAFDIIDLRLLFGKKKTKTLFFLVPWYTQHWFESSLSALSLFFLFGSSSSCFLLDMAMHSDSELHWLFVDSGTKASKPPVPLTSISSFPSPTLSLSFEPLLFITGLYQSPPNWFLCLLLDVPSQNITLLMALTWVTASCSSVAITYQMNTSWHLVSLFHYAEHIVYILA